MTAAVIVRPARASEIDRLTAIARSAKAHWGYPEEWLEFWRPSLTFTRDTLRQEWVQVAVTAGHTVGVVALSGEVPTVELSHLWIDPAAMGQGVGRRLFTAAVERARHLGGRSLEIVSDPHAEDFYLRLGASRIGEVSSRPAGRWLPLLELTL